MHGTNIDNILSSRTNFQEVMSQSHGVFTNNVKIKKRKREMVSDSDSDVSTTSKKNRKSIFNGDDVQFTIKQERISDSEDNNFVSKDKRHKKSKIRTSEEKTCESDVEKPVRRKKNHELSSVLIEGSLLDAEDNTFSEEAKRKKSKKRAKEHLNYTSEEVIKKKSKKHDTNQDDDIQDYESINQTKKRKKSKIKVDDEEITTNKNSDDDAEEKINSSNFANGIDGEVEAYLKKINCTGALSKSVIEKPVKNNHKELDRDYSSSRRKSMEPPSAGHTRDLSEILNDFENKNESLKKVFCDDSYGDCLNSNSSAFIIQLPINLNPNDLVGKEISFLRKKKIKTDDGKYITTSTDEVEPVMLAANNQCMRLHPTHVVTLEKNYKISNSETFSAPNFASNLDINVINPASLIKKNPIIGLEKEEYEKVLSSSVQSKLKAAQKKYMKYKNKKIKKLLPTEIKQENIKDEEIFKYLSQPSQVI